MLAAEFASFQFNCVQGTAVFYIYISMSSVASEDNFPSVYGRPNFATAQLFCLASSGRTDDADVVALDSAPLLLLLHC